MDPNFLISTPRLYISHLDPTLESHGAFIVHLYNTPEFIAANGGKPTSITTTTAAQSYIQNRFVAEHARNGYGACLVSLKPTVPDDERTSGVASVGSNASIGSSSAISEVLGRCKKIGTVSLSRGDQGDPNSFSAPDIGFAIVPQETRKGYAVEAARALIAWARRERGVTSVLGLCDVQNESSRAVLRRLEFETYGVYRLKCFGGKAGDVWVSWGNGEHDGGDLESIGIAEEMSILVDVSMI